MTTREIYFKNLVLFDLPIGLIGYTYKDKEDIIQIGKTICLELRTDEITVKKSIDAMKKIEISYGFMFWNNSLEGQDFFKNDLQKHF